jgi:galacturan 1,4-alpha-galacturonidase
MGDVLPKGVLALVLPHSLNHELLVEGALKRNLNLCFQAFMNDPCMTLPMDKAHELFGKMVRATSKYLKGYK